MTRGHVDDTMDPTWCGSSEAEDFLRQVFDINAWDLARKFEQFACNLTESTSLFLSHLLVDADLCTLQCTEGRPRDTTATMRAECTKLILKGLSKCKFYYCVSPSSTDWPSGYTTKNPSAAMNYVNYETTIVKGYHVKLVGWPTGLKMASPSQIATMEELRRLRDALTSDMCKWVPLSASEIKAHAARMAEIQAAPDGGTKKRKQRSDKGVKRKRKDATRGEEEDHGADADEESEDGRPKKKKAKKGRKKEEKASSKSKKSAAASSKSRLPPSVKSRAMISDSNDDDDDDEPVPIEGGVAET